MKKEIFILFTLLLLLVGCENTQTTQQTTPFIEGTTGLLISFLEDAPPGEIYDGGVFPFEVVVKLKNDGEWDVPASDVEVRISGVDPAEFGLQDSDLVKHPEEDLTRTYKDAEGNLIDGMTTYVSFPGFNYMDKISGNIELPLMADVCYKYGTNVVSKLCVKRDLTDTSEDSVCQTTGDREVFSSRGPLQVTSLKESVRGGDLIGFAFKIEHKGNGGIFQQNSNCDTIGITYENKIWVDVDTGMQGTKCTGLQGGTDTTGYVTMYSGERTITCVQPADSATDYEKVMNIQLVYDYKEDMRTELLVKHTVD